MMKIRYALLLSVSCFGFGTIAHAGLIPDITPVGKNTSIFTQRGAPAGESPLLVVPGIEKALGLSHPPVDEQDFSRTSYTHLASQSKLLSDAAPTFVIARRTSSDEAIHNKNKLAMSSSDKQVADLLDLTAAQGARSAILSPINPQQKIGSNGARLAHAVLSYPQSTHSKRSDQTAPVWRQSVSLPTRGNVPVGNMVGPIPQMGVQAEVPAVMTLNGN